MKRWKKAVQEILNKTFPQTDGLVYGFGHAVYTLSDPRAEIMRKYCGEIAKKKGLGKAVRLLSPL